VGLVCFGFKSKSFASETNAPTMSDLEDLLSLVQQASPVTNFMISADVAWKREPIHPLSTPEKVNAYIDKEIASLKSLGEVDSPDQEAAFRKQLAEATTRYATYIGTGKYTEYYYENRMRFDQVKYWQGKNDNTNATLAETQVKARPDEDSSYIVLDTTALNNIPIIQAYPLNKSALKTRVHTLSQTPILRRVLVPDIYARVILAALLSKTTKQKSDSYVFDQDRAMQLINGKEPSGFKVSMQSNIAGEMKTRTFIFINNISSINQTRLEFEIINAGKCEYIGHDLLSSSHVFIEEKREYGSNCMPVKFSYSTHNAGIDGYDFDFDHITISEITSSQAKKLFFDEYPKDYFYEDESSGKRVVVNLPTGMSSEIKDVAHAYGEPSWFNKNKTAVIRVIILTVFILPLPFVIFGVIKKRNSK
jgi:hypothetical protein